MLLKNIFMHTYGLFNCFSDLRCFKQTLEYFLGAGLFIVVNLHNTVLLCFWANYEAVCVNGNVTTIITISVPGRTEKILTGLMIVFLWFY